MFSSKFDRRTQNYNEVLSRLRKKKLSIDKRTKWKKTDFTIGPEGYHQIFIILIIVANRGQEIHIEGERLDLSTCIGFAWWTGSTLFRSWRTIWIGWWTWTRTRSRSRSRSGSTDRAVTIIATGTISMSNRKIHRNEFLNHRDDRPRLPSMSTRWRTLFRSFSTSTARIGSRQKINTSICNVFPSCDDEKNGDVHGPCHLLFHRLINERISDFTEEDEEEKWNILIDCRWEEIEMTKEEMSKMKMN